VSTLLEPSTIKTGGERESIDDAAPIMNATINSAVGGDKMPHEKIVRTRHQKIID